MESTGEQNREPIDKNRETEDKIKDDSKDFDSFRRLMTETVHGRCYHF